MVTSIPVAEAAARRAARALLPLACRAPAVPRTRRPPGAACTHSIHSAPLGRCSSEPEFSFGTQRQRENAAKATPSPGPVYEPRGTIRGAVDRPAYSFGNEIRLKNRGDARTPGPGNYGLRGAMGTQVGSVYRSSSSACFGTPSAAGGGGRTVMTLEGRHSPGPIYMNQAACVKQELSTRRSMPRTAFTRAQRFPSGVGLTASSPGPGEYVV